MSPMISGTDTPQGTETLTSDPELEFAGLEPIERRGLLGLLSRGGMVLVSSLAGLAATSAEAEAHGYHVACCHLARTNWCTKCGCGVCCPPGYVSRYWGCISGTRPIFCYECTTGGNCWQGSFACSRAIDQNAC